jgi:hypothetical protein
MSPKQVWSWHLVVAGALLFSQCNMAWRNFLWAMGSGCWSFDSPWCFISTKCGSSISAKFLTHRVHTVCFCTLNAILDPWCSLCKGSSLMWPFSSWWTLTSSSTTSICASWRLAILAVKSHGVHVESCILHYWGWFKETQVFWFRKWKIQIIKLDQHFLICR